MHSTIEAASSNLSSSTNIISSCVNHNSSGPQCCHCGERSTHRPNCPFRWWDQPRSFICELCRRLYVHLHQFFNPLLQSCINHVSPRIFYYISPPITAIITHDDRSTSMLSRHFRLFICFCEEEEGGIVCVCGREGLWSRLINRICIYSIYLEQYF